VSSIVGLVTFSFNSRGGSSDTATRLRIEWWSIPCRARNSPPLHRIWIYSFAWPSHLSNRNRECRAPRVKLPFHIFLFAAEVKNMWTFELQSSVLIAWCGIKLSNNLVVTVRLYWWHLNKYLGTVRSRMPRCPSVNVTFIWRLMILTKTVFYDVTILNYRQNCPCA
jgi:hypothetical protein